MSQPTEPEGGHDPLDRLDAVAAAVRSLAVEVRGFGQRSRTEQVFRVCINVVIAVGVIAIAVALAVVASLQGDTKDAAQSGKNAVALLVSCTDPGQRADPTATPPVKARPPGKCYARNQQESAPILAQLTDPRSRADAVVCAIQHPDDFKAAEDCALQREKMLKPLPVPTATPTPSSSP